MNEVLNPEALNIVLVIGAGIVGLLVGMMLEGIFDTSIKKHVARQTHEIKKMLHENFVALGKRIDETQNIVGATKVSVLTQLDANQCKTNEQLDRIEAETEHITVRGPDGKFKKRERTAQ